MSSPALRSAGPDAVAEAARLLVAGRLVAFPTETVYGLGADATNGRAVARIFAAKRRPRFNPLIVHVPDIETARRLVLFSTDAERLAAAFWPGPLTLVLRRAAGCPVAGLASAGLDTLAVRVPGHAVAQAVLRACRRPVAAPSANPSGRISPTRAEHVIQAFGSELALILDGGPCQVGLESSVVDLSAGPPRLLRPGAVTREQIEVLVGPLAEPGPGPIAAPGMLASHYAPALPVRLDIREVRSGEALLAFGPEVPAGAGAAATLNLSPDGDLVEAAANLFDYLHRLDRPDYRAIAVAPIPQTALGLAINDRLRRAAAPRTE